MADPQSRRAHAGRGDLGQAAGGVGVEAPPPGQRERDLLGPDRGDDRRQRLGQARRVGQRGVGPVGHLVHDRAAVAQRRDEVGDVGRGGPAAENARTGKPAETTTVGPWRRSAAL